MVKMEDLDPTRTSSPEEYLKLTTSFTMNDLNGSQLPKSRVVKAVNAIRGTSC